ncbi:MAG: hypothetical protein AAGI15_13540 [Pseudomonadota bacterium]
MFDLLTYRNQTRSTAVALAGDTLSTGETLLLTAAFASLLLSLAATIQVL